MRKLQVAAILILTFAVFSPALRYAFVYDDYEQLVINPRLTAWSYVPGYFLTHLWAHVSIEPPNFYRPLFLLWYRLVYAIFGAPGSGSLWHLSSILAHVAATCCVFILLRRLTRNFNGAALGALLFAIHPIQTEAVAWVSSAGDPLLAILVVLSVYFYIQRKDAISPLSLLFATMAMFMKEAGIVVPALIFVYEWIQSRFKNAIPAALPYVAPAALYFALRLHALKQLMPGGEPAMSFGEMVLTWPRMLAVYGLHLLWPAHLSVCYDLPMGTALWPLLVLIAVVAACAWALQGSSANVKFGAAWFLISFAPALAIRYLFPGDFVHDRYLYLPMVGLVLMAAEWLARIRFTASRAALGGVLVVLLCWGTQLNLRIWQNNTTLFERALQTAPRNPLVNNNLGLIYIKTNRVPEALPLLQKALQLRPGYPEAIYNLGLYYQAIGQDAAAQYYFSQVQGLFN